LQVTRNDIVSRAIGQFRSADPDYGARVEAAVKAARAK
jgi:catalase